MAKGTVSRARKFSITNLYGGKYGYVVRRVLPSGKKSLRAMPREIPEYGARHRVGVCKAEAHAIVKHLEELDEQGRINWRPRTPTITI